MNSQFLVLILGIVPSFFHFNFCNPTRRCLDSCPNPGIIRHLSGGTEANNEKPKVKMTDFPTEIRIKHLPNTRRLKPVMASSPFSLFRNTLAENKCAVFAGGPSKHGSP